MGFRIYILALLCFGPTWAAADDCEYLYGHIVSTEPVQINASNPVLHNERFVVTKEDEHISYFDKQKGAGAKVVLPGRPTGIELIGNELGVSWSTGHSGTDDLVMHFGKVNLETGILKKFRVNAPRAYPAYRDSHRKICSGNSICMLQYAGGVPEAGLMAGFNVNKITLVSIKNGAKREIILPEPLKQLRHLPGSGHYFALGFDHAYLVNAGTGHITTIPADLFKTGNVQGNNATHAFVSHYSLDGGAPVLSRIELATGRIQSHALPGITAVTQVAPSEAGIYFQNGRDGAVHFIDATSGRLTKASGSIHDVNNSVITAQPNGDRVAWVEKEGTGGEVKVFNRHTGKTVTLPYRQDFPPEILQFSPDGKLLVAIHQPREFSQQLISVMNTDTGEHLWAKNPTAIGHFAHFEFSPDGKTILAMRAGGQPQLIEIRAPGRSAAAPAGRGLAERIKTGAPLVLERDVPEIVSFFRSGKFRENPEQAHLLLLSLMHQSSITYNGLVRDFPEILALRKGKELSFAGIPPATLDAWTESARKMVEYRVKSTPKFMGELFSSAPEWETLWMLTPLLKKLPEETRKDLSAQIAMAMANGAQIGFSGIFAQKLFKFTKQHVRPMFGIEAKHLVDVDLIYDKSSKRLVPHFLSTHPIAGEKAGVSDYGLYVVKGEPLFVDHGKVTGETISEKTVPWISGDKSFSTHWQAKAGRGVGSLAEATPAPDYAGIWKDGKMNGLVVMGENMGHDPELIDEYLNYYKEQGFRFARPRPVADMKTWVEREISEGRLDYFVKEAHSDGMDRDLFRMFKSGAIQTGEKSLPNGKKETVTIFHPPQEDQATTLISNQEFGAWVRRRESNENAGPLVYFNTSCGAFDKACNELSAAGSKKLVVLAGNTQMDTFVNSEDSALHQMISGFRGQKTYAEIREMMKKDPTVGDWANKYLFPDQAEYQGLVHQKLGFPIDLTVETRDASGKVMHLDGGD